MSRPTDASSLRIIDVSRDPAMLERVYRLRSEVWREVASVSRGEDSTDAQAVHLAALVGTDVFGAARISFHETWLDVPDRFVFPEQFAPTMPVGSINRLVVTAQARGVGVARRLDLARLELAKRRGCACIVAIVNQWSGATRVAAVESIGFRRLTEGFDRDFGDWRGRGAPMVWYPEPGTDLAAHGSDALEGRDPP